jgi:hypothetical protein
MAPFCFVPSFSATQAQQRHTSPIFAAPSGSAVAPKRPNKPAYNGRGMNLNTDSVQCRSAPRRSHMSSSREASVRPRTTLSPMTILISSSLRHVVSEITGYRKGGEGYLAISTSSMHRRNSVNTLQFFKYVYMILRPARRLDARKPYK